MYMGDVNSNILPTSDYVFKRLFGVEKNKDLLIDLLNALSEEYDLMPEIKNLEYRNSEMIKKYEENRSGLLDVRIKTTNKTYVDVEVQSVYYDNFVERGLFYNSLMLLDGVESGSSLKKIPHVYSIWIIKDKISKRCEIFDRKTPIEIIEPTYRNTKFGDDYKKTNANFTSVYIFLSKFKEGIFNTNLENWLKFVDNRSLNGVTNDKILKAIEELKILRGDNDIRQMYETDIKTRLANDLNRAENIKIGKEKGLKEGLKKGLKEGIKQGKIEGLNEGIKQGLKKGEKNKSIEIAKNMLKDNIDINIISKYSGLTVDEINKLRK